MLSLLIICSHFLATPEVCSVYNQVLRNNPNVDTNMAKSISIMVVEASDKFNIDHNLYAAILMQESRYKLSAINHRSQDYGIAQININTINAFKLSKQKLLTDLHYSINSGALVLSDFKKRHSNKEEYYWTRYNASKPTKRLIYKNLVARYF